MNVREEEKRKNSCSGRGFGLAAAAIGVGVGAALYYIFNQRPENPNGEGSTTEGWQCEQPHPFALCDDQSEVDSDSYRTISEHSTSDTSIEETYESSISNDSVNIWQDHTDASSSESESDEDSNSNDASLDSTNESHNNSETSIESETSDSSVSLDDSERNDSNTDNLFRFPNFSLHHIDNTTHNNIDLDSDTAMDWEVTNTSAGLPSNEPRRSPILGYLRRLGIAVSPLAARQMAREDRLKAYREQTFRERSWTLEECSICFEVMLRDQEVMKLPCAHNFHSQCIMPWLQEKQTCPNCRKVA